MPVTPKGTKWIVDSGATHHFTSERSFFTTYIPCKRGHVGIRVGNGQLVKVLGTGEVRIGTKSGFDMILKNVWHARGIKANVLSVRALDDEGYISVFCKRRYKLFDGMTVVAEGEVNNGLYMIESTGLDRRRRKKFGYKISLKKGSSGWICKARLQILKLMVRSK